MRSSFNILVAEDNADDYTILEFAFRRAGFEIERRHVRDGQEAMEYLSGTGIYADRRQNPLPSLIISDLKMPRMNGLELLHWTRTRPVIKRIPFIILSGSGHPGDVNAAYDGYANSYHVKPNDMEGLVTLIKDLRTYWFKDTVRPDVPDDELEEANERS